MNIPIDEGDVNGLTPFMEFLMTNNGNPFMKYEEVFAFFKEQKVDINKGDLKDVTPVILMARELMFSRVIQLLDEGANVNANDKGGNFVLKYAVSNNIVKCVKLLLEKYKADPNKRDASLRTCLHIAVNNSSLTIDSTSELENLLLDQGADVNAIDKCGCCPLHYAFIKLKLRNDITTIDPIETVTTLCSHLDINLNIQNKHGKTPLHYAAQRNSTISSIFLLNRGAWLEVKDKFGNTPLAIAFLFNHPNYAITLIERNANVMALVNHQNYKLLLNEEQKAKLKIKKRKPLLKKANAPMWKPYNYRTNWNNKGGFNRNINNVGANPLINNSQESSITSCEQTVVDKPETMFKVAIKMGWQGLLYLLLDKNYDYTLAMEDALSKGKYQLLLNLLKKTAKDSTVQKFNDKEQNLLHVLALHGGQADQETLKEIYMQFVKRGVKHMATDVYGRSALHYAVQGKNQRMVQILLNEKYNPNLIDVEGYIPLSLLVKGEGIMNSEELINELLLVGSNINVLYREDYYQKKSDKKSEESYYTTPFIHLVRCAIANPTSMSLKKIMITFLNKGVDPCMLDSDNRDVFIYCALENSLDMAQFLLAHTTRYKNDTVDKYGRTAVHYTVRQLNIGSYQNEKLLDTLLSFGFAYQIPDSEGLTAVEYASRQPNGRMTAVFKAKEISAEVNDFAIKKSIGFKPETEWPLEVDFAADAEGYSKSIEQLAEKKLSGMKAKVDSIGNQKEPLEVIYDEKNEPYDCYMNKVNVRNGIYGEYLFYRMQLIRNTNRDVYMVYTRWGRIGESGMFQKTPFGTKEEAITEFCKIFKSKSGNEWSQKYNFEKVKKKFVLMAIKSLSLQYKQLIKPFKYKELSHKSTLPKPLRKLLKLIVDVASLGRAMSSYGINSDELPITQLKKETLMKCREILTQLSTHAIKLKKEQEKGLGAQIEVVEEACSNINELSNQYYELLPQAAYRDYKPPPLSRQDQLDRQYTIIEDLLNIETAAKILLGAQSKLSEMNPLDYCYRAMGVSLEQLKEDSEDFELIATYINKSMKQNESQYEKQRVIKIENIFRLQRRGEYEQYVPSLEMANRWLLFHGSSVSNFLGILSQGLRVAPLNVMEHGWSFGKGIYFADMFSKSMNYCCSNHNYNSSMLMLICEVALGKMANAFHPSSQKEGPPVGFDSVKARGSRGPNTEKRFYLNDGAEVPIGEIVDYKVQQKTVVMPANEYVVFKSNQVRMRYLIQWSHSN